VANARVRKSLLFLRKGEKVESLIRKERK